MDYGSLLWSPVAQKGDLKFQEGPLRTFTKRGKGMYKLNYWEHLEVFRLLQLKGGQKDTKFINLEVSK